MKISDFNRKITTFGPTDDKPSATDRTIPINKRYDYGKLLFQAGHPRAVGISSAGGNRHRHTAAGSTENDPAEARRVEQAADTLGFKTQKQKNLTTEPEEKTLKLRPFDPNTVDYEELLEMGLTQKEALSLIQYRAGGKIFRIPEEVDACYGIEHPRYLQIKPYIRIGRRYAKAPAAYRPGRIVKSTIAPEPFRIDTVSGRYLQAIGALTGKQARVFNKYRLINDGIRDMEDFRNCHVVNDSVADALEPYILFPEEETADENRRINLNTADSAELRSVIGIGEKTVQAILEYRERLGGFVRVEQLAEVSGVTESNYEKIAQQIYCDSCEIRKIDINFVAPKELVAHPYINIRNGKTLRKLLHERRLKGGWRTVEELIEDDIMTREEAARLAPYLVFNRNDGTDDSPKRHETETATEDAAPTQKQTNR